VPRLKVLFLPASYPSEKNPISGVWIKDGAKAASLYHDIRVLYACPDPSPQPSGLYRVSENVEDGITTLRARYRSRFIIPGKLLHYLGIFAAFRKLVKGGWQPDIIHAHFFTAGAAAVILGKMYKIPVVITEHSTSVATHSLGAFERRRLRFAMKRAQVILPVSHDLGGAIKNYYGIKKPMHVIPSPVNTEVFCPSAHPTEKERGKKKILLIAALTPRKGVPSLLEALSQIKNTRQDFVLDIVGDGANRSEYEQLTGNLGLDDVVRFHGRQPDIVGFIRECDFFVMPSLYENLGMVYVEAMACGKPVIATNAGGPREIVNDNVGITVPPQDIRALKEAIEYMLDNHQSYSPEKIAQYARENFGYEAVGRRLAEIYGGVALDLARLRRQRGKWRAGWSQHPLTIAGEWQVLDIGSGHNPHPRADVLVDDELGESPHRSWRSARTDNLSFVMADACSLPFKDSSFDYALALHIAEHMDNPEAFCKELMRVSKRGYIETPSKCSEKLLNEPVHKNFISQKGSTLVFERKHKNKDIKWFYGLFYYGRKRPGRPSISTPHKVIHLFLKAVNYIMLKIWLFKPVRNLMYTRFEWEQSFGFEVKD
jgi:glycosyltransferase involved in cell wall biosynthesis